MTEGTRNPLSFIFFFFKKVNVMSQQVDKKDQVEAMDIVQEDEETKQKRIAKETITGNYNYIEKILYSNIEL